MGTAILTHLLTLLSPTSPTSPPSSPLINHTNSQGNTPLHWTALNHHLPCLRHLLAAGADPSIINSAGHDAVFEAERNALSKGKDGEMDEVGRSCVDLLLGCKQGSGLERGVTGRAGDAEQEQEVETGESSGDLRMEG